jgi:hypothetical protein
MPLPEEEVGLVIVDGIHIRTAPNENASSTGFVYRGDPVMGTCYKFDLNDDGVMDEAWLGIEKNPDREPTRWIAVYFDDTWYMEGACQ